jgi:hypothetical protein
MVTIYMAQVNELDADGEIADVLRQGEARKSQSLALADLRVMLRETKAFDPAVTLREPTKDGRHSLVYAKDSKHEAELVVQQVYR